MAQQHMDRLSAVDAGFLHQESSATHMHIGGVAIFGGPVPSHRELLDHVRQRLPLVPRYRQRIISPPARLGRQRWIDDPSFNLEYHVRHTALPTPGDEERLRQLTARIFSQSLDRTKPLWELWLVEGLSDGRFALISKSHHALVDGISGVDLMTTLFDAEPTPRRVQRDDWVPRPEPATAELSAASVRDAAAAWATLPLRAAAAATKPDHFAAQLGQTLEGMAEVARTIVFQGAPSSPINVPITPHRRVAFVPSRLDDFKLVKNVFGGTVNDVVLAVVAGALRRLYEFRGEPTDEVTLRVSVPVSTRGADDHGRLGNRLTQVIAPLALHVADPAQRLRVVSEAMKDVKESKQAVGAKTITGMQDFAPPTILAQASRLNFSNRFFNLLVTNVPGPQIPIYALGRELEAAFPIAFLAGDRALAVAIMSYNGGMNFGVLGDYDALPDIDVIAAGLEEALADLVKRARRVSRAAARTAERKKARRSGTGGADARGDGSGGGGGGRGRGRGASGSGSSTAG